MTPNDIPAYMARMGVAARAAATAMAAAPTAAKDLALRALATACQSKTDGLQQRSQRLQRAGQSALTHQRSLLAVATGRLLGHDPQRVLQRGYAWVEAADGRPVVSAHSLQVGQQVRAVWADGSASTEVLSVSKGAQTPAADKLR